ncbi:serine/threonine-protein phosphatase [Chitinibacter bivalviorum]|uniref:Serine/threonine-protein phosphatase n=1 Tax=Chitinibacter bivalviorum TaxID=2739434 RepID=A0A7H9BF61_9NEIS|nr:protein phosphatase 2C domain-containing protein [Chitinibacter bivalviorum]QLG86828.1 serine/threonine-protein phosphatase [Chitinibacter bivalviorum]
MKFTVFQDSRKGGRQYNQDRVGYSYSRDALLLVVADGMGGHLHGEVAAQITVELLSDQFQKKAAPIIHSPAQFLADALLNCHEAIYNYAIAQHLLEVPRTTVVACIIQDDMAYWAHVGDSRLYLVRDGHTIAQTRDHSKVQKLVESGAITAEQALHHAEKNKIYNCLGGTLMPDIDIGGRVALQNADSILLCTDGLWGSLADDEINRFLSSFPVMFALPQLLDKAELRGGKFGDNLTALAINWHESDQEEDSSFVSTVKLDQDTVSTHIDPLNVNSTPEISDDDIEKAIAEIQAAINKYSI